MSENTVGLPEYMVRPLRRLLDKQPVNWGEFSYWERVRIEKIYKQLSCNEGESLVSLVRKGLL